MRKSLFIIWCLFLLAGCTVDQDNSSQEKEVISPQEDREVLAENLHIPWSINKFDETFYISERTGSIVKIAGGKQERQKVELQKPLSTAAEAGLLGLILSPDFMKSNEAFAYYTYEDNGDQYNRIVILSLNDDVWREEKTLIDGIPSGQYHHGGRLKIGPDGKLYATTGDAATNPEIAQDLQSLGGKILRINLDGTIPDDNPIHDSYVYSYGHRNPQGLAWTSDGKLYASEHGPSAHDEINNIQPGKNYGWPILQGSQSKSGMETPLFQSGSNMTWAPSGMVASNGKLYVATLRGNAVREFDLNSNQTREVVTGLGRIRDIYIEGNTLYFVSNNTDGRGNPDETDDKLYRVKLEDL